MTEGSKNMDPMDLWRQWYETSSKMWSDALKGGPESSVDPYGLYQQWVNDKELMAGKVSGRGWYRAAKGT